MKKILMPFCCLILCNSLYANTKLEKVYKPNSAINQCVYTILSDTNIVKEFNQNSKEALTNDRGIKGNTDKLEELIGEQIITHCYTQLHEIAIDNVDTINLPFIIWSNAKDKNHYQLVGFKELYADYLNPKANADASGIIYTGKFPKKAYVLSLSVDNILNHFSGNFAYILAPYDYTLNVNDKWKHPVFKINQDCSDLAFDTKIEKVQAITGVFTYDFMQVEDLNIKGIFNKGAFKGIANIFTDDPTATFLPYRAFENYGVTNTLGSQIINYGTPLKSNKFRGMIMKIYQNDNKYKTEIAGTHNVKTAVETARKLKQELSDTACDTAPTNNGTNLPMAIYIVQLPHNDTFCNQETCMKYQRYYLKKNPWWKIFTPAREIIAFDAYAPTFPKIDDLDKVDEAKVFAIYEL